MDLEHLILLVRERPEIYDPRHMKHRDRNFIRCLWADIAKELGTDQIIAKTKWQTLRSNFMRERRKLNGLSSGFGVQHSRITWPYMKLMSFLDKSVMQRDASFHNTITYNPFYDNKEQLYDRPIKEESVSLGEAPDRTQEDSDPDLMFLRSLLPTIKQLSPLQNLEFKGEVINLLKQKLG